MTVCNEIKRRIDEADDREALDIDIMRHTASCSDCRHFSVERASLRELIGSTGRVSAPMNFDAMLQARLAEAKTRRTPMWLNTAFYLRAGVATATLAAAVLVAQTSGFFTASKNEPIQKPGNDAPVAVAPSGVVQAPPTTSPNITVPSDLTPEPRSVRRSSLVAVVASHEGRRLRSVAVSTGARAAMPEMGYDLTGSDPAVLIPGDKGKHEIIVPRVSVGAQQLMIVNAGRQPQAAHTVPVSF